jgi:O-acetyl-ADP-ribose deacetylase (regulator of RNase III)
MGTQRTYHIEGNRLTLDFGSVLDVPAEVVVSSDDYQLTMGGGVSAAIRMAAGTALALDAAKAVPRETGDVVVTTAGALPARYVFHVVTIGPRQWEDPTMVPDVAGLVQRATRTCLELMPPLGARSIVFPALGTGTAGFPIEASAAAMAEVVEEVLSKTGWPLDVSIMLMSRTLASPVQYLAFYEEFARRVPLVAARETTQPPPARAAPPPPVSGLLDLEKQRQIPWSQAIQHHEARGDIFRAGQTRFNVALLLTADGRTGDALAYACAALRNYQQAGPGAATEAATAERLIADLQQR